VLRYDTLRQEDQFLMQGETMNYFINWHEHTGVPPKSFTRQLSGRPARDDWSELSGAQKE